MPEENEQANEQQEQQQAGEPKVFAPITSQEEFEQRLGRRLERERAKYADYADLQAKAKQYDELEDANKSEIEKANERVQRAEAEVAEVPTKVADALRSHLVALHEISDDDAELFLTATTPDVLLKQVDRLVARSSATKGVIPTQGTGDPRTSRASSYETGRERGLARYQKTT